jgi:rhodanese-related sulfurtransferase
MVPNKLSILCSDFVRVVILVMLSSFIGLAINHMRQRPLSFHYESKQERLMREVRAILLNPGESYLSSPVETISLEQMKEFVSDPHVVILDGRSSLFYKEGHIPHALNLPRDDFQGAYAALRKKLEQKKDQPIIVYCSGSSCKDSVLIQIALTHLGYSKVYLFSGGWEEWTHAGLTQEKSS